MDEHEDLEHLLRQGLRPRQTRAGFTARVMARLPDTAPVPPKIDPFFLYSRPARSHRARRLRLHSR